jgi:hypothetical protein
MTDEFRLRMWFIQNWSRASLLSAALLLLFSPFLYDSLGIIGFLIFLQLPLYLIHQYEEHGRGAFKAFANQMIGGGKDLLNDVSILWINGLVWIVDISVLYLAYYYSLTYGIISIYLTVINGLLHVMGSIALRKYNPGLWTSLFMFLPIGGFGLYEISQLEEVNFWWHGGGIVFAIGLHVILLLLVRLQAKT